jgi:23S rRNA (guanosine2251-2'-O)-methyltransferase
VGREEYQAKKRFYEKVLTIYGRNPVLEALEDPSLQIHRLHLSESNKPSRQLERMVALAKKRGIEIHYHDKKALSRISKNARQDQGVALDVVLENLTTPEAFLEEHKTFRLIALDRVTNPQNVGMIIRSCAAGRIDGIVMSAKGNAPLVSPLTIKASAGTLFKIPIIRADSLLGTLRLFREAGAKLYTLDSHASTDYRKLDPTSREVFILGNESEGVSPDIARLSDERIAIPMNRGVESLNVAVTASLLAFCLP